MCVCVYVCTYIYIYIYIYIYLSGPKPGHTTGGSGRGARWGGGAMSGRTGCQQNCSPGGQASLVFPKASKIRRLNVSPEARTSEILCKPMEEQTPRLTTASSPVSPRCISRTRSALSPWLLTSGPTPFCPCKPFSCKACPGTFTLVEPKTRTHDGRVGSSGAQQSGLGGPASQVYSRRTQMCLAPSRAL